MEIIEKNRKRKLFYHLQEVIAGCPDDWETYAVQQQNKILLNSRTNKEERQRKKKTTSSDDDDNNTTTTTTTTPTTTPTTTTISPMNNQTPTLPLSILINIQNSLHTLFDDFYNKTWANDHINNLITLLNYQTKNYIVTIDSILLVDLLNEKKERYLKNYLSETHNFHLFLLNNPHTHWSILLYHSPTKSFYSMDSLYPMNNNIENSLYKMFLKSGIDLVDHKHFVIPIQKQESYWECGYYSLVYAHRIINVLKEKKFLFDSHQFRQDILNPSINKSNIRDYLRETINVLSYEIKGMIGAVRGPKEAMHKQTNK